MLDFLQYGAIGYAAQESAGGGAGKFSLIQ